MKKHFLKLLLFGFLGSPLLLNAKGNDTLKVTAKEIKTQYLTEGTHRYLVYFRDGKNSTRKYVQFWTRNLARARQNGQEVITVTQEWEDKDTIVHTVQSVCEAKSFRPLQHQFWWKQRGGEVSVDLVANTLAQQGQAITEADTAKAKKRMWAAFKSAEGQFYFNWHLDMEVFPLLPYAEGRTFLVPFYDPGTSSPFQTVAYTVTGSGKLAGYNGQEVDCWLLTHQTPGNKEVFWVSKKTQEVLQLVQELPNDVKRYKVKMSFSL
jgi:hypothetical protein